MEVGSLSLTVQVVLIPTNWIWEARTFTLTVDVMKHFMLDVGSGAGILIYICGNCKWMEVDSKQSLERKWYTKQSTHCSQVKHTPKF